MKLTFIVTIDPVKGIQLLNILIHSLNLQTSKNFDVIFYNQTLQDEKKIFSQLSVKPVFDYQVFHIEKSDFFGNYPIWDLYSFHNFLLEQDLLNDYFMCMHMEEFFDVDYAENVLSVLEKNDFDILLGNLSRTTMTYETINEILATVTSEEFMQYLKETRIKDSPHWVFPNCPKSYRGKLDFLKKNSLKLLDFRFRTQVRPNRNGYTVMKTYEDLYLMKKEFAKRYSWFLKGHRMYFEDIHLCEIKGVCELTKELKKLTAYPIYFNLSKIYHIRHKKYYYQLQDEGFTTSILGYETDDTLLNTLKRAITMYKTGQLSLQQALTYTRQNSDGTGTQNLNYRYHMKYLGGEK
jgi:hypothetical protein